MTAKKKDTYLSIYWKKSSFTFTEYAEAAKIIKDRNFPCKLAKVDATEQKITAGKFDVKGYPTLKFFKSGKPMKYDGPRDAHVRFRAQSSTYFFDGGSPLRHMWCLFFNLTDA